MALEKNLYNYGGLITMVVGNPEQLPLLGLPATRPPQLLKWVGNKHRSSQAIAALIPIEFRRYFEPFVGTGAVLGVLAPRRAVAGDTLAPLIAIWQAVQSSPEELVAAYATRWNEFLRERISAYERIRARFNAAPNRDDLLFLSRSCYGGVVRFTREGAMSTPIGPHTPISPDALRQRVEEWRWRVRNTRFVVQDFEVTMDEARAGDVVYCDPPYVYTQSILYGAQGFTLERLISAIEACVHRGARVLLSLDGTKKSGKVDCLLDLPDGLFKRELMLGQGTCMLRRFQKRGESMQGESVTERLLLTW